MKQTITVDFIDSDLIGVTEHGDKVYAVLQTLTAEGIAPKQTGPEPAPLDDVKRIERELLAAGILTGLHRRRIVNAMLALVHDVRKEEREACALEVVDESAFRRSDVVAASTCLARIRLRGGEAQISGVSTSPMAVAATSASGPEKPARRSGEGTAVLGKGEEDYPMPASPSLPGLQPREPERTSGDKPGETGHQRQDVTPQPSSSAGHVPSASVLSTNVMRSGEGAWIGLTPRTREARPYPTASERDAEVESLRAVAEEAGAAWKAWNDSDGEIVLERRMDDLEQALLNLTTKCQRRESASTSDIAQLRCDIGLAQSALERAYAVLERLAPESEGTER